MMGTVKVMERGSSAGPTLVNLCVKQYSKAFLDSRSLRMELDLSISHWCKLVETSTDFDLQAFLVAKNISLDFSKYSLPGCLILIVKNLFQNIHFQ